MAWLFFKHRTNLFDGTPKKMLHIAPEKQFETRFKRIPGLDYITADMNKPDVTLRMDITNIQLPDNSLDVIFWSHVLEHIPDDRKAMRELHSALKPTGWAAIMVPLRDEKTFDDPSITDPAERKRIFGEADHFRRYGLDIKDRLQEAGFTVSVLQLADIVSGKDIARFVSKTNESSSVRKALPISR
jgi:SAM-dependent methyltransferase